jgi:hypothetical protein
MKVLKNKFENNTFRGAGKAGGNADNVYLTPPETSNLYQSSSILKSLDVLCEGPIEGLCLNDGTKAEGVDVFGAVYFNETPVKENTEKIYQSGAFSASNIQLVDRASLSSLNAALTNIESNINNLIVGGNDTSQGLAEIAENNISNITNELSDLFSNFDQNGSLINQLGIIQFNVSGVVTDANSLLYSNDKSPIYPLFLLNDSAHERFVRVENGQEIIKLPENIFAFAPTFNTGDVTSEENSVFNLYRITNFIGGGIMFFFIGDEVATGSGGEFLTGKFLTETSNANAIQSGINNGYDVLGTGSNFLEYLTIPYNQVSPARGETIGKQINFGLNIDNNLRFNFNKVKVQHSKGDEFQKPLNGFGEITRDYRVTTRLLGPFDLDAGADNAAVQGRNITDQFGNPTTISKAGAGNNDIRIDGSFSGNFATWNQNASEEHDGYDFKHIVYQNEVDSVIPTLTIDLLRDTEQKDDSTLGRTEPAGITFNFNVGFDGDYDTTDVGTLLEQGVHPKFIALNDFKQSYAAGYYGVVESSYLNAPYSEINLPKNTQLKDYKVSDINGMTSLLISGYGLNPNEILYPNESWKDLKRYITTQKTSYETESALIQRTASLYSITEKINSEFRYPFSSLIGTTLEARSFSSPPVRTYDAKLKKILIPSNYAPLRADGSDKRFIEKANNYGLRDIFEFNGSSYLKVPNKIDLSTENYEISFKVKLGGFNASTTPVYFIDVDGGDFNTPGRVAVYHRDNGGGSSPEIGMVGKDDAGNTDFLNKDISISAYSASDIFYVSLKAVGNQYTLTVKVGETLVGTQTGTLTNRPSFSYDPANGTSLLIGASTTKAASSFLDNGTQIADFKIKKNNQLLHFFDGTVIITKRLGSVFKDKFGGAHADIVGSVSTVRDSTFEFGKNKEQIYIGEWDGTFKYAWSDNPAWILYDLMVNPVYGIRNQIDDLEDIDIFELYTIGKYCDGVDSDGCFDGVSDDRGGLEPRFSCNILLNTKENAFNLIGNIASIFRCVAYWAGGSFNFSIDRPKEPTAIFNNSNILDGSFSYGDILKQSRFTRVEVFYADKNDFYKIKKEYVEDEDRIREYGLITNTQNGIGATSRSQARRLGKYILTSNKLETETIEFSTDQTALFLSPGDVIRVDDELKNFEINYGKILNSSFDGLNFSVEIENTINTGSIKTGDGGAIYLYKNIGQTEITTLYDIVKFDQTYEFGNDSDNYSGVLTSDKIQEAYIDSVFKTQINSISLTNNNQSIKLDLNVNDNVSAYASGIKRGSAFNLKLKNEVNEFYKITSIKEASENIYKINGLQYNIEKFNVVEIEDYQEVDEQYNIGVPTNNINRPTPPSGYTTGIENNNGFLSLVGDITGAFGGTETKYRVSLYYPNGSYNYKEFLKDDTYNPPITNFRFDNLSQAGVYDIIVTSLRNPESADSPKKSFTINSNDFSENLLFNDVKLNKETKIIQNEFNDINYKTGESITENDNFYIALKDNNGSPVSFNSYNAPYLIIKLFNEQNNFVRDMVGKYRSNNFSITQAQKEEFIENQRLYTLGFYLYNKDDKLEDTFMYSIENKPANVGLTDIESLENKIVFTLDMEGSLDTKKIEVYSSFDGENFSKLKTQNIISESKKVYIPISYSEIQSYNNVYYKFLPHDIIGTGNYSSVVSQALKRPEQTQSTSLPYSEISQQIDQSLVSVYFAQFNQDLSGEYFSNGSNSFYFKQFGGDGRELGYNLILDCSYNYSGSQEERLLSVNSNINLDLSSPETSGQKTSYKKKKYAWTEYGEIQFSLNLNNQSGIQIDQVNLEIEKFYK